MSDFKVDYQTNPSQYRHWTLSVDGEIATLSLDIQEDGGILPGYKLKLNSYDLGVDIELHDALQRVRFEHPEVKSVVVTSLKDRIFCSGANIFMLGLSTHPWKVNFCKFTNETRNGIEDSSRHSGLKFVAAVNGACAGGGYELALACDIRIAVESASFGLPEVKIGSIPGAGGTQRLPRIVGMSNAMHMLLTAERIDSAEALRIGLLSKVLPADDLLDAARAIAAKIAAKSPAMIRIAKEALTGIEDGNLEDKYRWEQGFTLQAYMSPDSNETRQAFVEKRDATF